MDDIKTWLPGLVESMGCQLYDLEWDRKMVPPVLRIMIDRDDEPVDLDICTRVSQAVSEKLDELDPTEGEYMLEVCSAGIDKPIRTDEELQKAIGSYVQVDLLEPYEGSHHLEGTLQSADEEQIVLSYFIKGRPKKAKLPRRQIKDVKHAIKI